MGACRPFAVLTRDVVFWCLQCLFLLSLGRFGSLTHKQNRSQIMFSEPLCHGRCLGADVAEARIGSVAVAAAADVVGVAGNADDARFRLFSEGNGLVCSFRFFCFGP